MEAQPQKQINAEFGSWAITSQQSDIVDQIKWKFDDLLDFISNHTPPENGRYLSIVKTKLEEACMFSVKGIAKK